MPNDTDEAEDRHSNFYNAWVNLRRIAAAGHLHLRLSPEDVPAPPGRSHSRFGSPAGVRRAIAGHAR